MKTLLTPVLLLISSVLMAQNVDTTKTKKDSVVVPKQSNYFDKYKKNNTSQKPTSTEPNLNLNKPEQKKVESNYIIEDNRVKGGNTTFKIGDKNKKKKN